MRASKKKPELLPGETWMCVSCNTVNADGQFACRNAECQKSYDVMGVVVTMPGAE
jgi:hypothetical protein